MKLIINVDFDDETDFDFLRTKIVGAVEDVIDGAEEEHRLDGEVTVDWETRDE